MRVKSKIRLGLLFLLFIIILLATTGSYYVNYLATESENILRENYNTLVYTKNMIHALDGRNDSQSLKEFDENLTKQENNITETGELQATASLRRMFEGYRDGQRNDSLRAVLRSEILSIQEMNIKAITSKNDRITDKTKTAFAYITILGTLCFLLSFTFVVNFPKWIADPISILIDGIKSISAKDYNIRIRISTNDEFGELAEAFNTMAEDLNRWEHSNVSLLMFEKSRIEAIINNMQDAVIGLDEKQNILFVNQVAESLLMLTKEAVLGKYAPDIALKNDLLRNLLNKNQTQDLKIYANNKESYFIKSYREVTSEGEIIGEVITLHNVTPFKELDSAKTNFIATVSHELKTPISAIKMTLQLLRDTPGTAQLNADQKQLVESIEDDTARLLKIIGELLNMTQLETGNVLLNFSHVQPAKIIDLAINAVHTLAEEKHIDIKTTYIGSPPDVNADMDKTVWVMVNLLTNAIRYSHEHGEIAITVRQEEKNVSISVKDSGIGMDPKHLPRIFDRYYKVPGNDGGTGLGLAISKEFIEAQGGKISVQSEIGKGSVFSVVLNGV